MSAISQPPGGFILSPPLSTTSSAAYGSLPRPRTSPLRPGGSKESTFIRYVDEQILHIQRRFAKRTSPDANGDRIERDAAAIWDNVKGYASMREVCKEMEDLVNTIWISGTPGLQIAYLLSVARLLTTVIPAMPPTPKQLFRLLAKLDHAFASLLQGRDFDTGEALPGFNTGRGVSGTEKVRVRSVVERTRKAVVEAFRSSDFEIETVESDDGMEVEDDSGGLEIEGDDTQNDDDDSLDFEMQIARVYDRTVIELGDSLETPDIGIITDTQSAQFRVQRHTPQSDLPKTRKYNFHRLSLTSGRLESRQTPPAMPIYGQHNVSVELLVSDLSASLTRQLQLRMGKQFNSDSAAISETLLRGDPLVESPVYSGLDGDCIHLGANNDKACLVVAAYHEPHASTRASQASELALALKVVAPIRGSEFDDVRSIKRPKDLKIETFLNGELLDITTRKCRRPSIRTTTNDETDIISGLRFHRQTEKPLTYRSGHSASKPSVHIMAERRWSETNKAISKRAQRTGFRSHGQRPPSCDYLIALSELPMHTDLARQAHNYAILDVVITTGKKTVGNLSAPCIKIPTILKDPTCTPQDLEVDSSHMASEEQTVSIGSTEQASAPEGLAYVNAPRAIHFANMTSIGHVDERHISPTALVEYPQAITYDDVNQPYFAYDHIDHERDPPWHEPVDYYVHSPVVEQPVGAAPRTATSLQYPMLLPPLDRLDHELDTDIDPELLQTHHVGRCQMIDVLAPNSDTIVAQGMYVMEPRPLHTFPPNSIGSVMDSGTFMPVTPRSSRAEYTPDTSPRRYYTAYQNHQGTHINTGNEIITLGTPDDSDVFEMIGLGPSPGYAMFDTTPVRFVTAQNSPHQEHTPFDGVQAPQYMSPISEVAKAMNESQLESPYNGSAKRSWAVANNQGDEHYDLNVSTDTDENDGSSRLVASAPSGATYSIKSAKKTRGRLFNTESSNQEKTRSGRRKHRTNDHKPDLTGSPVKPGANRTSTRWYPEEQTVEEALAAFQIPESCENSAVTFAGGLAMRQIPKAREAEFIKDEFVVGMRFIVF